MKTQITSFKELYIPKPCHQDWDKMTATEQGKFCDSCRKVVYDFSDKTEEDFNVLYKNNNGNICGRFSEDQIDQDYKYIANIKRNPIADRLRKAASFLITFITLKISSIREGFSQARINDSIKIEVVSYDSNYRKTGGSAEIQGQVRRENTEFGMEKVSVKLYDVKGNLVASTTTEAKGYFYLTLPPEVKLDQTFSIKAEKARNKTNREVRRYTSHSKEILQKNFGSVVLSMKMHSRWRRDLLGRKKRIFMGCPKFQ